jgi:serine/threonine protein kinase
LTIRTSGDLEKYTLNENHMPDHLCPTILDVKQILGSGGTGGAWTTLDPDGRPFVIKLSEGAAQRDGLLHESKIYRALALLDFDTAIIPRYFGFFSHRDFDVIVMEHTSSPIQDISDLSFSDRSAHFSSHLRVAHVSPSHIILKHCRALHDKGFMYQDLRAKNITRDCDGVLKHIDVGSLRKGYCRHRRRRREMSQRVRDSFCGHVFNWAKVLGLTVA